jgi:hypothetical protein
VLVKRTPSRQRCLQDGSHPREVVGAKRARGGPRRTSVSGGGLTGDSGRRLLAALKGLEWQVTQVCASNGNRKHKCTQVLIGCYTQIGLIDKTLGFHTPALWPTAGCGVFAEKCRENQVQSRNDGRALLPTHNLTRKHSRNKTAPKSVKRDGSNLTTQNQPTTLTR